MPRLPHYGRAADPPPMGFTPRDKQIIETIYQCEGVLADYQLMTLFFESERRMKARMSLLYQNRYVDRLTRQQQNSYGFMAYFLDELGIDYLCNHYGITPEELRPRSKEERTSLIRHDVVLNDVHIAVLKALALLPQARLAQTISSRAFWADHDRIEFKDGKGAKKQRNIIPDRFYHIVSSREEKDRHSRLLIEVDLRTEDNPRFVEEKVRPGLAYINSPQYKERFGANSGRWLVITTGKTRLRNMKLAAEKVGEAARAFYFTTFEQATTPGAFFTQAIWARPTHEYEVALFS